MNVMNDTYVQPWNVKTWFRIEISLVGRLYFFKMISSS